MDGHTASRGERRHHQADRTAVGECTTLATPFRPGCEATMCDLTRLGNDEQADGKTMTSYAGKPVRQVLTLTIWKNYYMIGTYTALLEYDELGDG